MLSIKSSKLFISLFYVELGVAIKECIYCINLFLCSLVNTIYSFPPLLFSFDSQYKGLSINLLQIKPALKSLTEPMLKLPTS